MATIDEVLDAMADEAEGLGYEYLVIDPDARTIYVPEAEEIFAVEADTQTARKHFTCPRYVGDNLDLASCFLSIKYRNANGDKDEYLIEDTTVSGENIIFSWLLSSKVAAYKGTVQFRFYADNGAGKDWGTTLASGTCLEGLEVDESTVEEETSDVVTQLRAMVSTQTAAVEQTGAEQVKDVEAAAAAAITDAQAQIEAKGMATLATIPEDYTTMAGKVNEFANAIKGSLSGEVVQAGDVSPVEHFLGVKARGKNLFDTSKIEVQSSDNIYISAVGVGSIEITTAPGYASNGHRQTYIKLKNLCPQMVAGKTYVLSADTDSIIKMAHLRDQDFFWDFGRPVTVTKEMLESYMAFYGLDTRNDATGGTCTISNIQIEEGTEATEYTPYIDPAGVKVRRTGKNLLTLPYYEGQKVERDGITGTVNADGSVYLVGTATSNFYFRFAQINLGGTPIPAGNSNGVYSLQNCVYDSANKFIYHQVFKGETVDKTVYPQVEAGTVKTAYEKPYEVEAVFTPAADGTVGGLTSLAPTMTLLTDTAGVNIECIYNRDTNAVLAEILEKIAALGG